MLTSIRIGVEFLYVLQSRLWSRGVDATGDIGSVVNHLTPMR